MSMEETIEVTGLRKRFGRTVALDGMSFTVRPGRVTGFVGPNGAGKSTTMRMILGLDAPDAGRALVGGRPYAALRCPLMRVGSLLDASALQPGRTGRNHLLWLARSQGIPDSRVDVVLGQVGLEKAARRKAGGYWLGMRQRLGIAAAMLGDPPMLMLDEPFNGMDPEGIIWMRGFLRSLAAEDRAVLVSSHLMSELEDTADHLVIVGRGKVIADISTRDLPSTVQAGLFVTSPDAVTAENAGPTLATAVFDHITVSGTRPGSRWTSGNVEADGTYQSLSGGFSQTSSTFTVRGSGDIAPAVANAGSSGKPADQGVIGEFAGLIVVIVVATMFITAEYRRGLIRTTLAATPWRGQVLAAKALVIGAVTSAAGLAGTAIAVLLGAYMLRGSDA
jgi:ABC-2 type transport system ATP-binding protein